MEEGKMRVLRAMLAGFYLLSHVIAFAQGSIAGVWEGKLAVAPGNEISVHFTLTQDAGGAYTAVLNSPNSGAIKDIAASSVSFDGTALEITVDALSGSYKGALADGSFTGEWAQQGSALPMNLSPYVATVLSEEAEATLLGQWNGKVKTPGAEMTIVLHFERNDSGEFTGAIQNADVGPNKVAMADIALENGELFFRVPQAGAEYKGALSGDGIAGALTQGGMSMELNVQRGEYVAELPKLALTEADYEKLAGSWSGALMGQLTLVLRFEKTEDGTIVSFIDSPTQGAAGIRVSTAALADNTLSISLQMLNAQFSGELQEGSIVGNWTQGGMTNPLTLSKQ
jgi:hypothetical protein